jgi:hypothetical protein
VNDNPRTATRGAALVLLASCLVALAAVSAGSLWIDEAHSALKAVQPTLAACWQTLLSDKGSDLQMPLYMLWLWAWEKIAGHTEWALRAANIPWFAAANAALWLALTTRSHPERSGAKRNEVEGSHDPSASEESASEVACEVPPLRCASVRMTRLFAFWAIALALLSPFLWSYLNEARPYVMQYAGACFTVAVLIGWLGLAENEMPRAGSCWLFAAGLLVLAGSSALGMAWAGAALLCAFVALRGRLFAAPLLPPLLLGVCGLGTLLVYYVWSEKMGGGASLMGGSPLMNFGFAFYELSGFSGIGPARTALRADAIGALKQHAPALVVALLALLPALLAGLRQAFQKTTAREKICALLYVALPLGAVLLLSIATGFRVLGRHLTPMVPALLLLLAAGVAPLWRSMRPAALALLIVWAVSCAMLRFSPLHRKDDYRSAAAIASTALHEGRTVWWAADFAAARYYGLPLVENEPRQGEALAVMNPTREFAAAHEPPGVLVLSKPDVYDGQGALRELAARYGTPRELPAFSIYTQR